MTDRRRADQPRADQRRADQRRAEPWRTVVRDGYDTVSAKYLAERTTASPDVEFLDELIARLAPRTRVLDAGCGAGVPVTLRLLTAGLATVGLDFSTAQLQLARVHIPDARTVQGDLASLPFPDAGFDAVVSYYAIIHVPRADHATVFAEVHRVLRPEGFALLCVGANDLPEDHDPGSWLGAPMYWSHFDAATNRDLIRAAGLEIVEDRVIADPMSHGGHLFVLARRPDEELSS